MHRAKRVDVCSFVFVSSGWRFSVAPPAAGAILFLLSFIYTDLCERPMLLYERASALPMHRKRVHMCVQ